MQPKPAPVSPEEYLRREEANPFKSEYVDGEIYAMSGATRRHNLVVSSLVRHAHQAADARDACQVFSSSMKVRITAGHGCYFYYPDLCVSCDPTDADELFLVRPCFIAEVLSPSTARIDRREKRLHYLALDSLREYAMIDQDRMRIELYRREGRDWSGYLLDQPHDVMESSCLGLRLTLAQIYADIDFPTPGIREQVAEYDVIGPAYI
jgi:Uma2 family endonuclease